MKQDSKFIISYDLPNKKWHIMEKYNFGITGQKTNREYMGLGGAMYSEAGLIISKCKYHYFDLIYTPLDTFPNGGIFNKSLSLNKVFKYKNVCMECKQKVNLQEFKQWMIIQKLKYL